MAAPHSEPHQRNHDTMVKRSPWVTGVTSWVVSARKQTSVPGAAATGTRSGGPPRSVQHQRAAAVASRRRLVRLRTEEDHGGNLAEPRVVVDQWRVAVLVRNEEVAGLVAQELRRLAGAERDGEMPLQRILVRHEQSLSGARSSPVESRRASPCAPAASPGRPRPAPSTGAALPLAWRSSARSAAQAAASSTSGISRTSIMTLRAIAAKPSRRAVAGQLLRRSKHVPRIASEQSPGQDGQARSSPPRPRRRR